MKINAYQKLKTKCAEHGARIIAVSKTKPATAIAELYELGQRHFGENRVQELQEKHSQLPQDILWHVIGHLQKNKVKYIAPYVHMIHSVDSDALLRRIDSEAAKNERTIKILLQIKIAQEDTKYGLSITEAESILLNVKHNLYPNIELCGLMGMATNTSDLEQVRAEFNYLAQLRDQWEDTYNLALSELSMGMSGDYEVALSAGSTMIRVGSLLFGTRT